MTQSRVISCKLTGNMRQNIEEAKQEHGYFTDSEFLREAIRLQLDRMRIEGEYENR